MFDTAWRELPRNVGSWERWASVLGGTALVAYGLVRPSPLKAALAAGGVVLVARGVTGHCPLYGALGIGTGAPSAGAARSTTHGYGKRGEHSIRDEIERSSEASFPASDAPSWTPTSIGRPATAP